MDQNSVQAIVSYCYNQISLVGLDCGSQIEYTALATTIGQYFSYIFMFFFIKLITDSLLVTQS